MPHLSPTPLTTHEQRLILRATAGNVRDHTITSVALGTGEQGRAPGFDRQVELSRYFKRLTMCHPKGDFALS